VILHLFINLKKSYGKYNKTMLERMLLLIREKEKTIENTQKINQITPK